jgi:hypothetical protein
MPTPSNPGNESSALPLQSFYFMSELRRATMWAIGGSILFGAFIMFEAALRPQPPLAERVGVAAFFFAFAGFLTQYLLHRVRIDDRGVSRRILWMWDLWPWDSFTAGEVRRGAGLCDYVDAHRPWWRKRLELGLLEKSDAAAINELIKRIWPHSLSEPVPESVRFEMKWPDKRVVQIDSEHVTVTKKRESILYRWDEVVTVEIGRLESDRPDFREFRLLLPDQEIKLLRFNHHGEEYRTWKGPSSEAIAAAVGQYAVPAQLQDWAFHGPPRSLQELDARELRETLKWSAALKQSLWCVRGVWGVIGITPLILPWPRGLVVSALWSPLAVGCHLMYRYMVRKAAELRTESELQRQQFAEN